MPTYDYECSAGHRYEKREPFGSPPQQPCEHCEATARRVLTAPPVVFKGSGWYKTDSRPSSSRGGGGDSSEPSGGEGETASAGGGGADAPSAKDGGGGDAAAGSAPGSGSGGGGGAPSPSGG